MYDPIITKHIGEYRYEVHFDQLDDLKDGEFDQEYIDRFEKGDLFSLGVMKMKECVCCCQWSEVNSLWGIHAASAEEALEYYLKEHDVPPMEYLSVKEQDQLANAFKIKYGF